MVMKEKKTFEVVRKVLVTYVSSDIEAYDTDGALKIAEYLPSCDWTVQDESIRDEEVRELK